MDVEEWIQRCRSDANLTLIEDYLEKEKLQVSDEDAEIAWRIFVTHPSYDTTGVSASSSNLHGATALHVACACGQEQIVDVLLRHRAPIDAVDKLGWTPVMQAARNGHSTIVNKLLAFGANEQLETRYGANLLFLASASNDLPTIDAVTNGISRVNLFKQTKATRLFPLAIAIVFDNISTIKELFKINSDVNISTSIGLTPLMIACAVGNPVIANFILDNNANIDTSNCINHTALDMSVLCQNNHLIRLLNGKRAEDEQIRLNRTHLTTYLSPHQLHHSLSRGGYPNVLFWPSPASHLTKHGTQESCKTRMSPMAADNVRLPSYLEHIISSALNSPTSCSKSPQFRDSTSTGASLFPHMSPYTKYSFRDSSSSRGAMSPQSTDHAGSPSQKPPDKYAERYQLSGPDLESGYGGSLDQDKLRTSRLFPRQGTPSVGKHRLQQSPIGKLKETNEYPIVTVSPCKKQTDSNLKSRWSGLHRTLSKLKSPKPKRSFSPQARQPAVSQNTASGSHLELVLQEMGLARYAPLFIKHELDVETFLKLTEDDLKEIGISAKSCEQILLALNTLKGNQINDAGECNF